MPGANLNRCYMSKTLFLFVILVAVISVISGCATAQPEPVVRNYYFVQDIPTKFTSEKKVPTPPNRTEFLKLSKDDQLISLSDYVKVLHGFIGGLLLDRAGLAEWEAKEKANLKERSNE